MLIHSSVIAPSSAAGGGRNTSPLSQIAGIGALWDLDATLSASYAGSGQTWANIITAPADGSAQTAYDFYPGSDGSASGDDPAFNGPANDPAAYWSLDGNDKFVLAGGNTAAVKGFHKTAGGQPATIILAVRMPASYSGTAGYFGNTSTASAEGIEMRITSGAANQLIQRAGSLNSLSTPFSSTPSAGAIHLMAFALDYTGGTLKTALDARSFTSRTLSSRATAADPSASFGIGWGGANDVGLNGTRLYGCYAFNKLLSDAELSGVIDVLNSRHDRTYA
jgi:hypothetical protein